MSSANAWSGLTHDFLRVDKHNIPRTIQVYKESMGEMRIVVPVSVCIVAYIRVAMNYCSDGMFIIENLFGRTVISTDVPMSPLN